MDQEKTAINDPRIGHSLGSGVIGSPISMGVGRSPHAYLRWEICKSLLEANGNYAVDTHGLKEAAVAILAWVNSDPA
jgi:hypothetical protein